MAPAPLQHVTILERPASHARCCSGSTSPSGTSRPCSASSFTFHLRAEQDVPGLLCRELHDPVHGVPGRRAAPLLPAGREAAVGARGRVLGRRRLRRPRLRPSAIRQDVGVDLQLLSPSAIPILYSVRVIHRFALVSAALNFTLPREGFEFLTIPV